MRTQDNEKMLHSILIVSGSEQFDTAVKKALQTKRLMSLDFCKTCASARQRYFDRYYDIIVISFPLPDESGIELAFDIAENSNAGVLIAAPIEVFDVVLEEAAEHGILVISKPVPGMQLEKAIRLLMTIQEKMHGLEQQIMALHENMEELRIVSKAKFVLVEKKHMTEDEAHRFIGKQAMNNGVSRKRIAEKILDDYE